MKSSSRLARLAKLIDKFSLLNFPRLITCSKLRHRVVQKLMLTFQRLNLFGSIMTRTREALRHLEPG